MVYFTHFYKMVLLFLFITYANGTVAKEHHAEMVVIAQSRYFGLCDGSAAMRIDANTLIVANDETNVLYSYDISGGYPVSSVDLNKMLPLKTDREIDIEAMASFGDRLYWIGSHGQNKNGKDRPNRHMLFATNIPHRNLDNLEITDGPYDLTGALKNAPVLHKYFSKKIWKRAPKKGGINIEGIVFDAKGDLLVGLRSPLSQKKGLLGNALVVTLAPLGNDWSVMGVTEIDLGNRGIRDIAAHEEGYLVIAGDVDAKRTSSLYMWNGSGLLEEIAVKGVSDLNPEAITRIDNHWLVLSDDGRVLRKLLNLDQDAQKTCKKISEDNAYHPEVFFRGLLLSQKQNQ